MKEIIKKSCNNCKYCKKIETELGYDENSGTISGGVLFKCTLKNEYIHNDVRKNKCKYYIIKDGYVFKPEENAIKKIYKSFIQKIKGV